MKERKRPKPRADRFLVGYRSRGNVVFGRDTAVALDWDGFLDAAQPMTWLQAKRYLRDHMPLKGAVIFELKQASPDPDDGGRE
jgi:hypothetical protein